MQETDYWNKKYTYKDLESFVKSRSFKSVGLTCLLGWAFAYLATNIFNDYAAGLFVWLPMVMGATSTLIYSYRHPTERKKLRNISYWTLLIFCLGLLTFAWEGVICIIMAAPIGIFFTWVGHIIAYAYIRYRAETNTTSIIIFLFLSVPSLMAFENSIKDTDDFRSVTTAVEINASTETVWRNVISFLKLKSRRN